MQFRVCFIICQKAIYYKFVTLDLIIVLVLDVLESLPDDIAFVNYSIPSVALFLVCFTIRF